MSGAFLVLPGIARGKPRVVQGQLSRASVYIQTERWHMGCVATRSFSLRIHVVKVPKCACITILDSGQFTRFPEQLSSRDGSRETTKEGQVVWHDRIFFVLATDGIAKWMINRMDAGENPIDRVRSLTNACSAADLVRRIERMPEHLMLQSDDVAAIWGVAMKD